LALKALYRLITGLDTAVGRIMDAVRDLGVEENTVVIYTSDHGSLYGEHGFGGKWLMYEESIRSPLIICDPRLGAGLRGVQRDEMVLKIDLLPTIVEFAGEQTPPSVQGQSLVPLVNGQHPAWRKDWFYEFHNQPQDIIVPSEGVRTEEWKYIRYTSSNPLCEQLFNIKTDPAETSNLAASPEHRDILGQLQNRWQLWHGSVAQFDLRTRWSDPV
jgi:arylsulfatase A-like enzyme